MKRSQLKLEAVACWDNLVGATWKAAIGKRHRAEVQEFLGSLEGNLDRLGSEIRSGRINWGKTRTFSIRDPKPRLISAPSFRDRVFHHALMAKVGPVLERGLVSDTFACINGRGTRAAIGRCQFHTQRFDWYAKLDVRQYFASIRHDVLLQLLERKFKNSGLLALIASLIKHSSPSLDRGLPIGALTSQHFANFFLSGLDRYLLETVRVAGFVRYMDDFIFWGDDKGEVVSGSEKAVDYLRDTLDLKPRGAAEINQCRYGVTFCGYRIFAGTVRLALSRRRRCLAHWNRWENAWKRGEIGGRELQRRMDSVLGMTADGQVNAWKRGILKRRDTVWYEDV